MLALAAALCAYRGLDPSNPQHRLLITILDERLSARSFRRQRTALWMEALDPAAAYVLRERRAARTTDLSRPPSPPPARSRRARLIEAAHCAEIGANDHTANYGQRGDQNADPAPHAIRLGWRAQLLEPVPRYFNRLRARYADQPRVQVRNAAVCSSCDQSNATIWWVDLNANSTTIGTNHSDPTCALVRGRTGATAPTLEHTHTDTHPILLRTRYAPTTQVPGNRWVNEIAILLRTR